MRKIKYLLLLLIMAALCVISCRPDSTVENDMSIASQGECELGILNAELKISSEEAGELSVCFGDGDGNVLEAYTPIKTASFSSASEQSIELKDVKIPPEASTLVLVKNGSKIELKDGKNVKIPEECTSFGSAELVFGALSDVHFNKYDALGTGDDAVYALDLALDFLESKGADLVAVAGDISKNGEEEAFIKYAEMIQDRDFEVLACVGNHDVSAVTNGFWTQYVTSEILKHEGVLDVSENGLDFTYSESDGEVFIFLNQSYWDYGTEESRLLRSEQLVWLEQMAKKYENATLYLFFHTFLNAPNGDTATAVGNLRNPGGYEYDLPYTYGTQDEVEFRRILRENKNIIFFSGHSHWMFEMEIYNESLNVSNYNGEYGYMVHVPSVTEPRYIGQYDENRTSLNGQSSQGYLIYVYDSCTVLLPYDFISGTCYTEYIEILK